MVEVKVGGDCGGGGSRRRMSGSIAMTKVLHSREAA